MPSNDDRTDVERTFSRCESCGTFVVSLAQHRCPTDAADSRPDRGEREDMADEDDRDGELSVGLFPNSQGNRYAYHDLDGADRPRCGCAKHTEASRLIVTSLAAAKRQGRSPCGSCRRLRELDGRGDGDSAG
jgi:hypothetical protein